MIEKTITVESTEQASSLFGDFDENIDILQKLNNVVILSRGTDIKVSGDEVNVDKTIKSLEALLTIINNGERITNQTVRYVSSIVNEDLSKCIKDLASGGICFD